MIPHALIAPALFATTFCLVYALAINQLNVQFGLRLQAFITCALIESLQLVLYKLLPRDTSTVEIACYIAGGCFGVITAMSTHRWLTDLFDRGRRIFRR